MQNILKKIKIVYTLNENQFCIRSYNIFQGIDNVTEGIHEDKTNCLAKNIFW